jgi:hypothetical protein
MAKLLNAFASAPSAKTASAVVRYAAKHPMWACLLSPAQHAIYQAAVQYGDA